MSRTTDHALIEAIATPRRDGEVWPGAWYDAQLARLRAGIGQRVYLVEIRESAIHLAVHLDDKPLELLAVVEFPKPDPSRNLLPHLIVLSDGRGINLGRVTRISVGQPFLPAPRDVLFENAPLRQALLGDERTLNRDRIAAISHMNLAALLATATLPPLVTDASTPIGSDAAVAPEESGL
ncbi:MAG: hypothetical protein ACFCUG_08865 [Thiotrichales bacterium]